MKVERRNYFNELIAGRLIDMGDILSNEKKNRDRFLHVQVQQRSEQ